MNDLLDALAKLPREQYYHPVFDAYDNNFKFFQHDVLHLMKSVGLLARAAEHIDHGEAPDPDEIRKAFADLLIVIAWAANECPTGPVDLRQAVIARAVMMFSPQAVQTLKELLGSETPAPALRTTSGGGPETPLDKAAEKSPASVETVIRYLRCRDIVVFKDVSKGNPETPRWRVDGKGLMTRQEMLDYANKMRRRFGLLEFYYGV